MKLLQRLKKYFDPYAPKANGYKYIFPYADDVETRRQQIWTNLQYGLLLEDTGVFIPWTATYAEIHRTATDSRHSGDRTNYFLGEHAILNGIRSFVGVFKWADINDDQPFLQTDEFLGTDDEGNRRFLQLKEQLTALLGQPTTLQMEKFGHNDIGSVEWVNGKASIYLSGIEQFACKYRMYIGLKSVY
jgi:hypothetical protein